MNVVGMLVWLRDAAITGLGSALLDTAQSLTRATDVVVQACHHLVRSVDDALLTAGAAIRRADAT